jgi:hypothetical protein
MRWVSLLLLLLCLGCGRPVLIAAPPVVEAPADPDPRQLWHEETDTPSFHRVYQRLMEPWWL